MAERIVSFGKTADGRKSAARKHAQRIHVCRCGRTIMDNAYYWHRKVCKRKKPHLWEES